jgi:hypothetical protein
LVIPNIAKNGYFYLFLILVILLQLFQLPKKIERYIKEMKIIFSLFKILATALPYLRISSLLAIVRFQKSLVGTGALLFSVMYIQSIGSGFTSFGDIFIFSFVPIDLTNVLYLSLSTPLITSQRLQQFLEKHQIKPRGLQLQASYGSL